MGDVALAEFDRRRLWVDLGYPSLFDFLHRDLGLSKASASFRKKAAELIQRFPEALEPIRDGRLCLSSVFELAKVLTPENRGEVLPRFFQLSRRDARAAAAALRPDDAPPRREIVTAVRVPAAAAMALAARSARAAAGPGPAEAAAFAESGLPGQTAGPDRPAYGGSASSPRPVAAPGSLSVEPLTAELNRLHLSVSRRFLEKLEAARAALSHAHPGASASEVLEAGLDLLLARQAKAKGLAKRPRREPRPSSNPDHVPAHVKREVWERDGGKCQWPLASGGICGSTSRVQLDHRLPRARGGPPTVENLRCLCQRHNDLAAREAFGDEWMDRYTRNPRAVPAAPPP